MSQRRPSLGFVVGLVIFLTLTACTCGAYLYAGYGGVR